MNLYAYLRVGPRGRIYIPAEFWEHIGLPEGPAFIEAKLCDDGFIELGPVIPGSNPPRVSEVLPGLVVPETFDEPLPADELAAWESDGDLWDETAYLLRSPDNARRLMEALARDKAGLAAAAGDSAHSVVSMPDGWTARAEDGRVRLGVSSPWVKGFWLDPDEARCVGLALRIASLEAREAGAADD
ncbi:Conserved protein of uncharacterised function, putative antitoxin [Mycobacteroides abscessus subsp. abscessus]|nr:Conserved protein of uncharacterised function, putative antitoxin [Mycobacteroides abscessus subsp. abscessus]SHS87247.1 Conserved protein of uncharacterised function, putative antitoxin [Mycobacteroides abscessus subsp. abscessus]SHT71196.1 Conserved protein of uncharacterised function, putative antitoxin [Mycobacteroides abscessus subsp. abscessus]SHU92827.1 Conserved protein of uncharacterised function, putative antitoxin [Mycobacteroides abscessus subsp. abscessus]SHX08386.1 Conserved pr